MQCTRQSSVPSVLTEMPQTLKELMITSVVTDSSPIQSLHCSILSLSGALILPAAHACGAGSIRGREEIEEIR